MKIVLPIPRKELWPNSRPNRYDKAKAVKETRANAKYIAQVRTWNALRGRYEPPRWTEAETRVVFYMPTQRTVDRDNAAASLKPIWDGIADAGVVANDSGFVHFPPEMRCDKARPRVEIEITEV